MVSPTFALEAEQLLESGFIDEALEICRKGLESFPVYQSAYMLIAKAYIQKGDQASAFDTLNHARSLFPRSKSVNRFIEQVKAEVEILSASDKEEIPVIIDVINETFPEPESSEESPVFAKEEPLPADEELTIDEPDEYLLNYIEENFANNDLVNTSALPAIEDYYRDEGDLVKAGQLEELNPDIEVGSFSEKDELDEFMVALDDTSFIVEPETETVDIQEPDEQSKFEPETEAIIENEGAVYHEEEQAATEAEEEIESQITDNIKPVSKLIFRSMRNTSFESSHINELRASNLNLIPGLDYSPLKVRTKRFINRNHIKPLPEPPPFPEFSIKKVVYDEEFRLPMPQKNLTIKDLASQLKELGNSEKEYLYEPDSVNETDAPLPVTETMAKIYFMQGAYGEAAKAYRALASQNPDKKEYFIKKAEESEAKF